ncbi:MAG: hypothetical protein ABSF53_16235 [Terracidiphilus sp.]|jgi:hypothetical protein
MTHVLISFLGLWLLFLILRSMIRIALINRHYRDFFAETAGRTVYAAVSLRLRGKHATEDSHPVLLWLFPAYLLLLILVYFVGAMVAFLFLYWGTGAVASWRQAFLASGSALNTLGFATPTTIAGQLLAIPEGALGLGIVVFLFTFIPGYQAVIRSREDKTSWLYVRTGDQPTGVALLEWCHRAGIEDNMREVWESWEDWFRMLGDTHSVLPMLSMSPSVQGNQSWVRAAAAVLDAAAFAASSFDTEDTEAAKACVRTGTRAFVAIANALGQTCASTRQPTACRSKEWYDAMRTRLHFVGLSLRLAIDAEPQRREFLSFRGQYEDALLFVASQTFSPLEGIRIDTPKEEALQIQ